MQIFKELNSFDANKNIILKDRFKKNHKYIRFTSLSQKKKKNTHTNVIEAHLITSSSRSASLNELFIYIVSGA
ncbi:hypothetical protein HanPSC8_Chr05g0216521 [Helianthus annuus]|nr:hypothetical protein HanPSC8_Chr05g0216521 [Helianthus annuus]